jgi:hypothetical protein
MKEKGFTTEGTEEHEETVRRGKARRFQLRWFEYLTSFSAAGMRG